MRAHDDVVASAGRSLTRRSVMAATAWSVPVIVLGVAAPASAASGLNPDAAAEGPTAGGNDHEQVFTVFLSDLPLIPAPDDDGNTDLLVTFCLPEGLAVLGVTASYPFTFPEFTGYDGGGVLITPLQQIPAGSDVALQVTVGLDPIIAGLQGDLFAEVYIFSKEFEKDLTWQFDYGVDTGVLVNCGGGPPPQRSQLQSQQQQRQQPGQQQPGSQPA